MSSPSKMRFTRHVPSTQTRLRLESLEDRLAPATFTVTKTGEAGLGSLRRAIHDANANPGADIIAFNIEGAGVHTIAPTSPLPTITDRVTIAGHTQPGFAGKPVIELNGAAAGPGIPGLILAGGAKGSVVRGLVINRFLGDGLRIWASYCGIVGNYIGTDATGESDSGNGMDGIFLQPIARGTVIGGTTPGARNVISGNGFAGLSITSSGNRVLGNYIGTNAVGTAGLANGNDGVFVGGYVVTGNVIGGTTAGSRNIISGNVRNGIWLTGNDTSGNVVQGNSIGTDVTGTVDLGNSQSGVAISYGATNNLVGGTSAAARNVISGNDGHGVLLDYTGTSGNRVLGNRIGTAAASSDVLGNGGDGVRTAHGAGGNRIGGTAPATANVIAHNGGAGVRIQSGTGNSILGNRIFANGGLGIDLGPAGVTPNDVDDPDVGANRLINFPILYLAHESFVGGFDLVLRIRGSINTEPNRTVRIEFFVSPSADPSGYGEGARYLGSATVTTGASNTAAFNVLLSIDDIFEGQVVTATATDLGYGNTSEFSAPVTVTI